MRSVSKNSVSYRSDFYIKNFLRTNVMILQETKDTLGGKVNFQS